MKKAHQYRRLDVKDFINSPTCLLCEAKAGVIPKDPKEHARRTQRSAEDKMKITVQRELLRRELCRRHLLPFVKRFEPAYRDGWLHRKICAELERFLEQVVAGEEPRLMLFVPPRLGKSLLASNYFPSWALGKHPHLEIISSSYSDSLPLEFSRRIKSRLESDNYKAVFPDTRLHPNSQKVEHWRTTEEGGYLAAGVGGGITGHGCHTLIIDDPIKDAEQADSETVRESVWSWWSSVASTRVAPGGGVLIIQTRWNDDDLSGRLLQQMYDSREEDAVLDEEIENWRVISFPAIAEDDEWETADGEIVEGTPSDAQLHAGATRLRRKDESLHEDRWPLRFLKKKRRSMLKRHWSALYQQKPVPDEGVVFTTDMFMPRPKSILALNEYSILAAFDLAIGVKQSNDYTVGVVGGIDRRGRLHLLDMIRGRWGTYEIVEAILSVYRTYRPLRIGIELGQLQMAIDPVLKQRCKEAQVYPVIDRSLRPILDKQRRAAPLQGMMQHHQVLFPSEETHPWMRKVSEEMLRFPAGRNDDIVDAMAWLARMALATQPPGAGKSRVPQKSWKDRLQMQLRRAAKHPMAA